MFLLIGCATSEKNLLSAESRGYSSSYQLSIDRAKQEASLKLADNLNVFFEELMEQFAGELNSEKVEKLQEEIKPLKSDVIDRTLRKLRITEKNIEGKQGNYRAWIKLELPENEVRAEFLYRIIANRKIYDILRESSEFIEFKKTVQKLPEFKSIEKGL